MNRFRRQLLLATGALLAALLVVPVLVRAQAPAKVPRVGLLMFGPPATAKHLADAFASALAELGYVDGKPLLAGTEPECARPREQ
jgi:hypothetical protein